MSPGDRMNTVAGAQGGIWLSTWRCQDSHDPLPDSWLYSYRAGLRHIKTVTLCQLRCPQVPRPGDGMAPAPGAWPGRTCEDTSSSSRSSGEGAENPPLLPSPVLEPRHHLGWTPPGQS